MKLKFSLLLPALIAIFLSTSASAEKWVSIGKPSDGEVFFNDYAKDENNFVFLKQRYVFLEQQHAEKFDYFVSITSFSVDCNEKKVAFTEFVFQDNSGRTTYAIEIPREKWEYDKEKYENYGAVCNTDTNQISPKSQEQRVTVNWKYFGKNNDGDFYIDTISIKQRDGLIYVWQKVIFSGNQNEFLKYRDGKLVSSALFNYVINCSEHTSTLASTIFKDANESAIDYVEREPSKWIFSVASPGSIGDALINTTCTAPSEMPAKNESDINSPIQLTSTGSGFFVNISGALLTNQHVVNDCAILKIRDSSKIEHDVTVVATDAKNDLALLQMIKPVALPAATFRAHSSVEAGENVVALGYPLAGILASEVNVSFGYVSATAGLADDTSKLQISAPVQPGNSGGPLLDQAGNLIGVVVAKLDAIKVAKAIGDIPQNINFAVKGEVAQVFLKAHKVKFKTAATTKKLGNTDIASRGRAFTVLVECWK